MEICELMESQRQYFDSGATLPVGARLEALERLGQSIRNNENAIAAALESDLNKSEMESYVTETGMVLEEIGYIKRHLRSWARARRVKTPLAQFSAKSFIYPQPYGLTLIMSPWNYPFQLCMIPLIGAIAAGNCAIVKPSAYAPATSRLVARLVEETFPKSHVAVIEGGRSENAQLLEQRFDYIFFTGSVAVGRLVMSKAAEHLTPVSLELGGKSPVIIEKSAKLPLAAKRLAFGKFLNAGQTCVAPDYLLIQRELKDEFVALFKKATEEFYPGGDYSQMPHIVNEKHFNRVTGLIEGENVQMGGISDPATLFIQPTLLTDVSPSSPIMQEEIFGPVLPVLTYDGLDEAIAFVKARPRPLALYLFTESKEVENKVLSSLTFGGGCINDTIIHLATSEMGFGGVGDSGMGSYHGKRSFDTFTHHKSMVKKHTWLDLPMRYLPYDHKKLRLVKKFMK